MEKFLLRLLLIIVLISFGVFYGIDMAGRGMDEVQEMQEEIIDPPQLETTPPPADDPPKRSFTYELNESETSDTRTGWAGRIGKLLQQIAHGAVEGINSVFDRIVA